MPFRKKRWTLGASILDPVKKQSRVTIVDYGMGNLWSVANAFHYLGAETEVCENPKKIRNAEVLILPGVGSFLRAMVHLRATGLAEALKEAVFARKRKILGICLGMQLMAEKGMEDGESQGLGLIPGNVERFSPSVLGELKLPHIGFNRVTGNEQSRLFSQLRPAADFYFVHSFRLLPAISTGHFSLCHYGTDFLAAYEQENIYGVQFHPEKSQTNGLRLLQNFLSA
jgi:glutamine amidotransferase